VTNAHGRNKPFWFYPAVILGGFLPWSVFFPQLVHGVWKKRHALNPVVSGFFTGWTLIPALILSCATSKLATYVLFLFPPLSIAMAYHWDRMHSRGEAGTVPKRKLLPWLAGTILVMLVVLFSQLDHLYLGANTPMKELAARIRREEGTTPARVFMCEVRLNGMEFYLQRFVERTDTSSDRVLFSKPNDLVQLVKEGETARHVEKLSHQHAFIVLKEQHYLKDPVFQNWRVLLRSGTCILLAPPSTTAH
jgi:hypothetical protein